MVIPKTGSYLVIIVMLNIFILSNCLRLSFGTDSTVVPKCLAQLESIHSAHSDNYLIALYINTEETHTHTDTLRHTSENDWAMIEMLTGRLRGDYNQSLNSGSQSDNRQPSKLSEYYSSRAVWLWRACSCAFTSQDCVSRYEKGSVSGAIMSHGWRSSTLRLQD